MSKKRKKNNSLHTDAIETKNTEVSDKTDSSKTLEVSNETETNIIEVSDNTSNNNETDNNPCVKNDSVAVISSSIENDSKAESDPSAGNDSITESSSKDENNSSAENSSKDESSPASGSSSITADTLLDNANKLIKKLRREEHELIIGIIALLLFSLGVFIYLNNHNISRINEDNAVIATLTSQLALSQQDNSDKDNTIADLNDKISVLSEALTTKATELDEANSTVKDVYSPKGAPLKGRASLRTDDSDEISEAIEEANLEFDEMSDELPDDDSIDLTYREVPCLKYTVYNETIVIATGVGTVETVTSDSEFNTIITIDHGYGYRSIYRCNGKANVEEGDTVIRGYKIATVTSDSSVFYYHIKNEGQYIDPISLMDVEG